MAARFWVGGTGTWDTTNTANWSATTGGAGGASVPTTADTVTFDSLSGTGTVTTATGATCSTLTIAASSPNIAVTLGANLSIIGAATISGGVFSLSTYTFSCTTFTSSVATARTINFGTGQINCTGTGAVWTTTTTTLLTVLGTPVINITSTGSTAISVATGTAVGISNLFSFNITGGTYAFSTTAAHLFNNLNFTGFSGSIASNTRNIYGNLTLSSTMTTVTGVNRTNFVGTSGVQTITSNGCVYNIPMGFNGIGGTFKLAGALTLGANNGTILHTNGTLDLNGYTATCLTYTTGIGTKNITFNAGTLVCTAALAAFSNTQFTNFTTTAGTGVGVISLTSASSKTFTGGGSTYNCTLNQGGAGALSITGANTFNNITNTVQPATVTFPSSTVNTNTFVNFNLNGTAGNLITINSSTAGTQATLSYTGSPYVSCDYLSIQDLRVI